ncbi:hypothetical protein OTSUT76_1402 [Orientia tsutsugamushi str. UT76]|uniref:Uncharacterized protein n=1 Tax=Orientia tsutsugamushi TaxID=784 RepID=A0A2U3QNT3_ORITS|nr:hypothetical protein OTSUT76_1402 [Orientia tsutsugamushi str. UT76]SPR02618.1 Uncharacterised protein [Orientia tsutsugamushi]
MFEKKIASERVVDASINVYTTIARTILQGNMTQDIISC